MGSVNERVVLTKCGTCGETMRQSRFIVWCHCGKLMSNNYGVFEEI